MTPDKISRRTLGGSLAAAGLGVPLMAACGSDGAGTASDPAGAGPTSSGSGVAVELTATSDIEVGGGSIFADQQVVVTQPSSGTFKCFTAVCTHQGCIVSDVSDGTINCACHGSQFSIEDGSVVTGPATSPLAAEAIEVSGDSIILG